MPNNVQGKKRLISRDIGNNRLLIIDPHNAFWAIIPRKQDTDFLPPQKIVSLHEQVRNKLDAQMDEFRFSANLTAIYVNPTDRCNANCPYCYIPAKIRKSGAQMNKEQLEYVLGKIVSYFKGRKTNVKPVVIFHASEPLLVKDIIFEAISNFEHQFYFGIQTNALLLEKADVEFLKKYRVGVGISLDSFDPQMNNKQRLTREDKGNFDKAVQAIDWFAGYEGLNVITTITKLNVTHLPELVKFLHFKRVGCVLLNPVRLTSQNAQNLQPDQKLLAKYFIDAVEKAMELSKLSRHRIESCSNF